jgi:hypothetical protein
MHPPIQNWTASAEQVDAFISQTALVPAVVLDSVTEEVMAFLAGDPQSAALYETLHGAETTAYIEGRSALVFENNASFRKHLLTQDPRPFYFSFVRHWVASVIQQKFPALFGRLPSHFGVGLPLRNQAPRSPSFRLAAHNLKARQAQLEGAQKC